MTVTRTRLTSKAATVEKALRMSVQAVRKPSKYRNQPVVIDNIRFASKAEGRRYQELRLLEKAFEITLLRLQPRFDLYAFGIKICTYVGDFEYFIPKTGQFVVEDVKGVLTPEFKIKARMFSAQHKYEISIIKAR